MRGVHLLKISVEFKSMSLVDERTWENKTN